MTNIFFLFCFIQKPGIIFTKISHLLTWYFEKALRLLYPAGASLAVCHQSVRAKEAKSKHWVSHHGLPAHWKYRKIKKRKKATNMIKLNKSSQDRKKWWGSTQKSCWANSIIPIDRVGRTQSFCEKHAQWLRRLIQTSDPGKTCAISGKTWALTRKTRDRTWFFRKNTCISKLFINSRNFLSQLLY